MLAEGDLTWGAEHTIQDTGDVLDSCTAETSISLLTNVTLINSIRINTLKIKINKNYYFLMTLVIFWPEKCFPFYLVNMSVFLLPSL